MAIAAWRKAIAEFVGAFTLIFIGAGSILSPGGSNLLLVAFAHGLALGAMVSARVRVSGGHFIVAFTPGAFRGRQITPRLHAVYSWSLMLWPLARGSGLTISTDIMMGGPRTGAAMNPARWFGPAVVSQFFDNCYVYWFGPFLGAIVAGLLYSRAFLDKTR